MITAYANGRVTSGDGSVVRNVPLIAESILKICDRCKNKTQCADLPGICLKLPRVLVASVAIMVTVLFFNSTL